MNEFARNYAAMSVEDIERLALDIKSLVPEARAALRLEMQRRQLPTSTLDWTAQPEPHRVQTSGALRLFFRNFGIFFVCDVLYVVLLAGILSAVKSVDAEKLGTTMATAFLNISFLAAILTSKFFVPKTLRAIWILGAFTPPCAFMLFLILR